MSADEAKVVAKVVPDSAHTPTEPLMNGGSNGPPPVNIIEGVVTINDDDANTTATNGQVTSQSEDPPALVHSTSAEATKDKEASNSLNDEAPMEVDEERREEVVDSHSDREDSPGLVIVTQPDEEAPEINNDSAKREDGEMSGEEIDLNVPLEDSSDEEEDEPLHNHHTSHHPHQGHTPHLKYITTPPTNGQSHSVSIDSPQEPGRRGNVSPGYRSKQVAKLKQFFTTLQGFGNKLGSEAAEQVQELITALVNKTASIEEFHQEIQTVTNHPLKQFIIPFLQDNLDYLRVELKESSKTLSDILNHETDAPSVNSFSLTSQPADDELPVYKTPQSSAPPKPLGVISSHKIRPTTTTSDWRNGQRTSRSSVVSGGGAIVVATSHQKAVYGTGTVPVSRSNVRMVSHSPTISGTRMSTAVMDDGSGLIRHVGGLRKRDLDRGPMSQEKDTQTITGNKQPHVQYISHSHKRPRTDHSMYADDIGITSRGHSLHPPPYPQPPHTYPIPATTPTTAEGLPPRSSLGEDWKHLDMMVTSMQGMMERTRQAVALLKDRITVTQSDLERRELDQESIISVRVADAVDKVKQRAEEDKQSVLMETRKQIREAVTNVRTEMETRMTTASTAAVQEAIKEAHKQSSSKENCWNCGRKATETCSGCNKARYCGTFCQHKDWSNHMHHCASGLQVQGSGGDYERRRGDVGLGGRANKPLPRGLAVPVNIVQGGDLNLRHIAPRPMSHSHSDIAVKTEKT